MIVKLDQNQEISLINIPEPSITKIERMEPKRFCRLMFDLVDFPSSEIAKIEQSPQYIQASRLLLTNILEVSWQYVVNWSFLTQKSQKIPQCHQRTLWLYWEFYKRKKIHERYFFDNQIEVR